MVSRIVSFVIIFAAILFVILFAFIATFEGWTDVRVNELKEKVATLQNEATQAVEVASNMQSDLKATIALQEVSFTTTVQSLNATSTAYANDIQSNLKATIALQEFSFTTTVQSLNADIDRVSQTATSTAYEGTVMAEKFDQLSATATSDVATVTAQARMTKQVKYQETVTFDDKLNITFDNYHLLSPDVTITVQSPNSASQTFDISPGEVVSYKNYTILRIYFQHNITISTLTIAKK